MNSHEMHEIAESVAIAQAAIGEILKALEIETGMLVENVSLKAVDVTTVESATKLYQMHVQISILQLSGHRW